MWFPYLTLISGWIVAEVGRYPFVVYGVLTQFDAVSPNMTMGKIITSICIFVVLDLTLIAVMLTLSHRAVKQGIPTIEDTFPAATDNIDFFGKGGETHA
jgi:cytochrome d ubiquinol oxidase subunit I